MQVVSAASEPICQSKQQENTRGHDHTEFWLINHQKQLIYFNAWFERNDGSQIVQEDIPHYKVAVWQTQMK